MSNINPPPHVKDATEALVNTLLQGVREFITAPDRSQAKFVQNAVELERALEPGTVHRAFIAAYSLTRNEIMDGDSGERLAERMLALLGLSKISTDKRILLRLNEAKGAPPDQDTQD